MKLKVKVYKDKAIKKKRVTSRSKSNKDKKSKRSKQNKQKKAKRPKTDDFLMDQNLISQVSNS